jgi:hypothetical protein
MAESVDGQPDASVKSKRISKMSTSLDINYRRVIVGGVSAGAALYFITGFVNGGILAGEFQTWSASMGNPIHPKSLATSLFLWATMSLIYGIVGVWIYAFIRSSFGAGPKTALIAGLVLWVSSKFTIALDLIALGFLTDRLILEQLILSAISMCASILIGAWLYRPSLQIPN